MEYDVVLRVSGWDCYAGWASFRMHSFLDELKIKFRTMPVKPINAHPEISITSKRGKVIIFYEKDLEPENKHYKDLTNLLSKIWAEQNTFK